MRHRPDSNTQRNICPHSRTAALLTRWRRPQRCVLGWSIWKNLIAEVEPGNGPKKKTGCTSADQQDCAESQSRNLQERRVLSRFFPHTRALQIDGVSQSPSSSELKFLELLTRQSAPPAALLRSSTIIIGSFLRPPAPPRPVFPASAAVAVEDEEGPFESGTRMEAALYLLFRG